MEARGLILREGMVVDVAIIAAPSSTQTQSGQRDPDMHQLQKGNQRHFGVKANIGVDSDTGVTHSLVTKPAHAAGERQAHALLHASKRRAFGDPGWVHTSDPRIATDR